MSKEVQELFTSIAPSYDFLNHFLSLSIDKRWRDKAISALGTEAPKRALDLCAGTLDLTQKLLEKFPSAEVAAVDFAIAMLEEGRNKVPSGAKIWRICADGHQLPLPDRSFDAVFCGFGIRNLEDREQAAAEIRRVLRPKGKLVVLEFFKPDSLFSKLFYRTYGQHVLPRLGGAISKNRKAYEYLQNSIQQFLTVEEYQDLLRRHELIPVQASPLSGGIAHLVVAEAGQNA